MAETPEDKQTREAGDLDREEQKSKLILFREGEYNILYGVLIGIGALVVVILLMGIWYLWSARHSTNMVGAEAAHLDKILTTVQEKLNDIDINEANQRIKDVAETQKELTGAVRNVKEMIANQDRNLTQEFADLHRTHLVIDAQVVKLGGVSDELKRQIAQDGNSTNELIKHADEQLFGESGTIPKVNASLGHLNDTLLVLKRAADGLPTVINDLDGSLKDLDAIELSLNGTIKKVDVLVGDRVVGEDGKVTGTGLTGIVEDFHGMSTDSRNKLHSIFYPPPPKGFFGYIKYGLSYVATPIFEGGRLYFQLHSLSSLPVRLVSPIPK